jgi:hypothetical protein
VLAWGAAVGLPVPVGAVAVHTIRLPILEIGVLAPALELREREPLGPNRHSMNHPSVIRNSANCETSANCEMSESCASDGRTCS